MELSYYPTYNGCYQEKHVPPPKRPCLQVGQNGESAGGVKTGGAWEEGRRGSLACKMKKN